MKLDSIPMDQGVFVFRADSKELEEEFVKRLIRKFKDISIISEDRNDLLAKERSLSVNLLPKGIFNIKDKERLDKVSKILKDSNIKGKEKMPYILYQAAICKNYLLKEPYLLEKFF